MTTFIGREKFEDMCRHYEDVMMKINTLDKYEDWLKDQCSRIKNGQCSSSDCLERDEGGVECGAEDLIKAAKYFEDQGYT